MPGGREHDRQVEELRRALYRPGSGGDELRTYLDASRTVEPEPAAPARAPRQARPERAPRLERTRRAPHPRRRPVGPWPRIAAGALLLGVLLALPALAGDAPVFRLPDPAAGAFSTPFAVPAPTASVTSATAGLVPLWDVLRGTSTFAATSGDQVASGAANRHVFPTIAQAAVAASGLHPLTVFVACSTGTAEVAFEAVAQDFDAGYSFQVKSATVPCGGVQVLRYRRPAGVVPYALSVSAPGPVAVSVVAGL